MTDAASAAPAATVVTVYPMTGRQLFFSVPHAICEGGPGLRKLLRDDRWAQRMRGRRPSE